jgi:fucose permease
VTRGQKILLIGIAYAGFIVLGLPNGLLGVAWPSIRGSFGISLDAVGVLLIATTTGYLLSSFSSGPLISRIGVGTLLTVSSLIAGVGFLGYSVAPTWWFMILCGLLAGAGAGAIDAGLNSYFATNHGANLMNWLHAFFGFGAMLGPIVMTAVFNLGQSWRWGYVAVGVLQMLFTLCLALTRGRWRLGGTQPSSQANPAQGAGKVSGVDTLRLPVVWFGIALFFVFTGVEGSAGQWPYSLFTEARGVAPGVAGLWVSIYWGSLTVGRMLFGLVTDRLGVVRTIRLCMVGVALGSACIWCNVAIVSFVGLALVGFCVAPLFPSLISVTPGRAGAAHAANAIGFQVASASLGIPIISGLAGVLAERMGLEIVGPFLLATSVVMLVLHEAIVRRQP